MSIENAILVHAASLSELAAAVRALVDSNMGAVVAGGARVTKLENMVQDKAAELATTTEKRAATARASTAKDAKENAVKPDADLDAAVAKVEDNATKSQAAKAKKDADAAASAASSQTDGADSSDDVVDGLDDDDALDYIKDVRPVLLAAIKKAGKDKVQALISTYGVDKADKIEEAKWGDLLGKARALALAD